MAITDLLNPKKYVKPEVREKRLAICHACPDKKGFRCGICHCVLTLKASLSTEQCPAKPPKWLKEK